jgi:hypothetical protein
MMSAMEPGDMMAAVTSSREKRTGRTVEQWAIADAAAREAGWVEHNDVRSSSH